MSKNGTSAGSGSGASRKGRTSPRSAADAHRASKGDASARIASAERKALARVRKAELDKRKIHHVGGKYNANQTDADRAAARKINRTLERSQRRLNQLQDMARLARKRSKS